MIMIALALPGAYLIASILVSEPVSALTFTVPFFAWTSGASWIAAYMCAWQRSSIAVPGDRLTSMWRPAVLRSASASVMTWAWAFFSVFSTCQPVREFALFVTCVLILS